MSIEELYSLCIWIKENVVKKKINNNYQQLRAFLQT